MPNESPTTSIRSSCSRESGAVGQYNTGRCSRLGEDDQATVVGKFRCAAGVVDFDDGLGCVVVANGERGAGFVVRGAAGQAAFVVGQFGRDADRELLFRGFLAVFGVADFRLVVARDFDEIVAAGVELNCHMRQRIAVRLGRQIDALAAASARDWSAARQFQHKAQLTDGRHLCDLGGEGLPAI